MSKCQIGIMVIVTLSGAVTEQPVSENICKIDLQLSENICQNIYFQKI